MVLAGAVVATLAGDTSGQTDPAMIFRDQWLERARSADPKSRRDAMHRPPARDTEVRAAMLAALTDDSTAVREAAAFALADTSLDDAETSALAAAFRRPQDPAVASALAYAIGSRWIVRADLVEPLLAGLASSEGAPKLFHAFALRRQRETPTITFDEIAREALPLLAGPDADESPSEVSRLARAVAVVGDTTTAGLLADMMASAMAGQRASLDAALTQMVRAKPIVAKASLHLLHDGSASAKTTAAARLGALGVVKPSIVSALRRCARHEPAGSDVQLACIDAAGHLGNVPPLADMLVALTSSSNADTRSHAAYALFRVDQDRLEAALPTIWQRDEELAGILKLKLLSTICVN